MLQSMQATKKFFHEVLCFFWYNTLTSWRKLGRSSAWPLAWNEPWFALVASTLLADVLALSTLGACYAQYSSTRMVNIRILSFPIIGHRKVETKAKLKRTLYPNIPRVRQPFLMFWKWSSPWWSMAITWRNLLFSLLPKLAFSQTDDKYMRGYDQHTKGYYKYITGYDKYIKDYLE